MNFDSFIESRIVFNAYHSVLADDVSAEWTQWNSSSEGSVEMLNFLMSIPSVRKEVYIRGVSIRQPTIIENRPKKRDRYKQILTDYERERLSARQKY